MDVCPVLCWAFILFYVLKDLLACLINHIINFLFLKRSKIFFRQLRNKVQIIHIIVKSMTLTQYFPDFIELIQLQVKHYCQILCIFLLKDFDFLIILMEFSGNSNFVIEAPHHFVSQNNWASNVIKKEFQNLWNCRELYLGISFDELGWKFC